MQVTESFFFRLAATLAVPLGITALLFIPQQVRESRLRRRGVTVDAVCLERVRRGGGSVTRVNCTYRTPDGREYEALVNPPSPVPRPGGSFTVVYDPVNPRKVDSSHYLGSVDSRVGHIIQSVFGVLVAALLVMLAAS
ncbi:hypothetical protein L7D48_06675 [Streptomyces sp. S1A]|uniref:DUF3592 domain-containing protein n=1 Tax=Streptomyces sp. ICN903 TaxID=2964654 RepID=UPI001EDA6368|nr:DUF3592 domain-containing protein [Streptomyces sp. ICN903]MCG3040255.1 hypothetical protein [Streptomyces sp. ICN903]